tara:strand:- start:89443 stop:90084 length:642 start_codon:yes stop_codon:yes gene_type:complete
MSTLLKKLSHVHRNAPLLMQPRIARLIEAINFSEMDGVDAPITHTTEKDENALSVLQDNADSFLALMRTLPKKHPFKKNVASLHDLTEKLEKKLADSSEELAKLLELDQEDIPGIKASDLATLKDMLADEVHTLRDLKELTGTLQTLADREHKEEKDKPVEHSLPEKGVGPDDKKDKDSGSEDDGELDLGLGDELEGGPMTPELPPSTPNILQ